MVTRRRRKRRGVTVVNSYRVLASTLDKVEYITHFNLYNIIILSLQRKKLRLSRSSKQTEVTWPLMDRAGMQSDVLLWLKCLFSPWRTDCLPGTEHSAKQEGQGMRPGTQEAAEAVPAGPRMTRCLLSGEGATLLLSARKDSDRGLGARTALSCRIISALTRLNAVNLYPETPSIS